MFLRNLACFAALGVAIWAQAPVLNGKFILAEENTSSATLGILTFSATGSVAGTEYVQASGITQAIEVTGNYIVAADGSGTLTLHTQVTTEDGLAPAVTAVYEFLSAKAGGFVAIRRDSSAATLADILPASTATGFTGAFLLADEGASPSGQAIAEIGLLTMKADGSLSGRVVVKQNSSSDTRTVDGSYIADGQGFGTLKLTSPMAVDEDGGTALRTNTFVFLATAKQELIALRTDNTMLGLARLTPLQ